MVKKAQKAAARPMLDIDNVIAAFSEEHVQTITGLSKRRLRYWAATGFFKPSFVEGNAKLPFSRFYSFKDIVALRTLEILRIQNNVPLQHLRKVAEALGRLKDELWTDTTLVVWNRKVAFENPETGAQQEVLSGQYLLGIPLKKIIEDTTADIIKLKTRQQSEIGRLSRSRGVNHNQWVVAGTRIPVATIKRLHEDGLSVAKIIEEYPDLTAADIDAALGHEDAQAA